jgi:hypothetical protein
MPGDLWVQYGSVHIYSILSNHPPTNVESPFKVYAPEILPLAHRAKGEGLATACLWLSTFVVVEIVPVAIANIGWRVYLIFACFNLAFIPFIYFFVPEVSQVIKYREH